MASLDTVSLGILIGALLVLAGIRAGLVALRFGAPLLLVFLIVGMLAGQEGPGGIKFDDVRVAYIVGSVALALILFDGGRRTPFAAFRPRRRADRVVAGRLCGRLHRRGRGVLPHSCARPALAPTGQRHARDRIRDQ